MKTTAVIMAGGKGERFWPRSRKSFPKQFLSLVDKSKTLIQQTAERILPFVDSEDIYVVTNKEYVGLCREQLPSIPAENILAEPVARNTAPCIGLAAVHIQKKYSDATMVVLASDHVIKYEKMFLNTLKHAIKVAQVNDNLLTIGITPSHPDTGYGYINFGIDDNGNSMPGVYNVKKFVEKPDIHTAKEYLDSGMYLWNSGMFVWKCSTIMTNIKNLMPEMHDGLMRIERSIGSKDEESVLAREYADFQSVSIDYGVMERASNIYTIPGSFGWDDVGSWLALERINPTNDYGNIICGNVITIDSKNTIVQAKDKLIALVGVDEIIVIDTEDALLICNKDCTQNIKKVIENLKICNRNQYL
jgi:mannose-1-phosphate guanylyltransferase